jgi:hypothetical protein
MRWTQFKVFACVTVLCTTVTSFAGAQAPGPAVDALVKKLDSAKSLSVARKQGLASAVENATASQNAKLVVGKTALEVLDAAGQHGAALAQARSLVDQYKQALLAATACAADCDSINAALTQSAEQLLQALRSPYYVLKRDVYTVTLSTSPIVRIQCNVANDRGSDAVVFDPQDTRGLTRYAVLPQSRTDALIVQRTYGEDSAAEITARRNPHRELDVEKRL